MASISTGKNGSRRILFFDANRKRKIIYLGKTSKRDAEAIKTRIELLVSAALAKNSIDSETAEWLGKLESVLHGKLVKAGLALPRQEVKRSTLGPFLTALIEDRTDVKESTATIYGHTKRCLLKFFGTSKPLEEITAGDADRFRRFLGRAKPEGEGLADNTVNRRCGIAKQFFRAAKRQRLIAENPFADMKGVTVRANKSREFFITREMAAKVLEACPGCPMAFAICA